MIVKWTNEYTWKTHHHSQSSFIYPSREFVNNPIRGIDYVKKHIVPHLGGGECHVSSEIICINIEEWNQIKNSKVLIIGGGPSTNDFDWNPDEYDAIISCNHFFKNEKIKNTELFMVFLGDEVDLSDRDLINYLEKNPTLVCFENIGRNPKELKHFKAKFADQTLWAHTRYHSKVGAMPRIISLICGFNPSQIDIVGMDGYIKKENRDKFSHSFQDRKSMGGTIESSNREEQILQNYKKQYLEFWDYALHDIGKKVRFKNLGHNHPCNISTEVLSEILGNNYEEYLYNIDLRS